MKDIFLSYSSDDLDRAEIVAEALQASGWSLWWDRQLKAGQRYDEKIQTELEASRCVVVLWSEASVNSRWVKAEAQDAGERQCLLPVFLDKVHPPLEFRLLNGVDLTTWDGAPADREFQRLLASLSETLGQPARAPVAAPPQIDTASSRSDEDVHPSEPGVSTREPGGTAAGRPTGPVTIEDLSREVPDPALRYLAWSFALPAALLVISYVVLSVFG